LASVTVNTEGETTISYRATDNAGNAGAPKTLTVRLDKSALTVGNVTPPNGKTAVRRNTDLTATFDERMDRTTLTTSTFKLYKIVRKAEGTTTTQRVTNTTVSSTTDGLKAKLNPFETSSTLLAPNTRYKAVVTTGARDVAGNALDQKPTVVGSQSMVWTFTTGSS